MGSRKSIVPQTDIMGPPPIPLKDDVSDKYKKLKRRYFQLEEKHKEISAELHRSGERNVKMRSERDILLDRIIELETQVNSGVFNPSPSNAFPKTLLSTRARNLFTTNLRQAMNEEDDFESPIDPLHTSRHVGPAARKRAEEEKEEESRSRSHRRTATPNSYPLGANHVVPSHKGKEVVSYQNPPLKSKPPIEYTHMHPPPPSFQQQAYTYPPPHHPRSQSPTSPQNDRLSPVYHRNGNGHSHSPSIPHDPSQSPTTTYSGATPQDTEPHRHAKPKRLKAHTVTSKSFSIPMVPRDKKGQPMLPLNVGIMTVVSLGEVCMREHFHTERYIFPVGYEVTRRYLSTLDPNTEVVYSCSIVDGGDGPKFQIVPSDIPDQKVIAGTATGAWSSIVKQANSIRHRQHSNSVSGPDFFGLGQNTIKHLIQGLPGASSLKDYVWQNFVEGGPLGGRHAAVIPALPEDYGETGLLANHHPDQRVREQRRRQSITNKEEPQSPPPLQQVQPQTPTQTPMHPGLTTIVLPPPTTAETLNIHEYHPPIERRPTKGRGSMRWGSNSPGPNTRRSPSHTRTTSRSENAKSDSKPAAGVDPSPPPPVPKTFASIMNAYPAPDGTPKATNGNGESE